MTRALIARGSALLLAAVVAGCERNGTVSGEVTYDGRPVEKGWITFLPADGKGPPAGGPIARGKYKVENVLPGAKVVKVEAVKSVPFARSSAEMEQMAAANRNRGDGSGLIDPADAIPPDAVGNNCTIEVGKGSQMRNFELTRPR